MAKFALLLVVTLLEFACVCLFKNFVSFLGLQQVERKVQRFPIYPLPSHIHSLLHHQRPSPEGAFAVGHEPTLTLRNQPKSIHRLF